MILFSKKKSLSVALAVIFIFLFLITISCKTEGPVPEIEQGDEKKDIDDGSGFKGTPDLSIIANISIPGQAIDVCVSGDYAYLTSDLGILYVIDIGDKTSPVIIGKCRSVDSSNIVIVKGDFAYITYTDYIREDNDFYTRCGFYIVDVSDKNNPELIGNYISGDNNNRSVYGLFVGEDYAYVETSIEEEQDNISYLEIVNIIDKEYPEILTRYELDGAATSIWVEDDLAFINANFYDYEKNSYSDESRIIVVDLEDKSNPRVLNYCVVDSISSGIYLIDGYAFVTSWQLDEDGENYTDSILQAVNVKNPDDIKILGECEVPGGAWEMDSAGEYIYVSSLSGGLYAVNLEDKEALFIADSLNTGGTTYDVATSGNYAYVVDGFEGLYIVKMSDNNEEGSRDERDVYNDNNGHDKNYPPEVFIDFFGESFMDDYFQIKNPVYFSSNNTYDPDGDELSYIWNIDGSKCSEDKEFRYYFEEPGEYEIELIVSDGIDSSKKSETISVAEINRPVTIKNIHDFKVEIEYTLMNKSDTIIDEIECFMRIPQTYYPYQVIKNYNTGYPVKEELFDNDWNSLIHFEFDGEELGKDEKITAYTIIDMEALEFDYIDFGGFNGQSGIFYDKDDEDYKKYTSDELFIDSESPEIKNTTDELIESEAEPLKITEILYNFVIGRLSYDFPRAEDRNYEFLYASEILERGRGVCADYAILYTAMLRSAGIPSRLSAGIPVYSILYEDDREIDLSHAWVEVKLPGYGWFPIDITPEEKFMSPNYYLNVVTEKGNGYLYENKTMDWRSYYYEGFLYSWNGFDDIPVTEQGFKFRVDGLELEDIELDRY
ncbi:MAG: transglutaminase domain-containing protein [Actinomycetota bacterium]|nr:transglutaminase domain-containing protein [Actinomycetota bacterium]